MKLVGADALLAGRHQIHRLQPQTQRDVGHLEHRAHRHGEGLAALVALLDANAGALADLANPINAAALRANRAIRPDAGLYVSVGRFFVVEEARAVDVQVQVAPGLPAFKIVGLPDKAVAKAASGCARPSRPRARTAAAPHHGQSRAGRSAQGRQPLRPAHRARAARRDGRPAEATRWPATPRSASSRSTARSPRSRCAAAALAARQRAAIICRARMRRRSGLGRRRRDHRGAEAARDRQPLQGRAGAGRARGRRPPRAPSARPI